jgi:hypothetical protein
MQGCDGSVLLDASSDNPHPEKEAPVNIGLAAFDLLLLGMEAGQHWPGMLRHSYM